MNTHQPCMHSVLLSNKCLMKHCMVHSTICYFVVDNSLIRCLMFQETRYNVASLADAFLVCHAIFPTNEMAKARDQVLSEVNSMCPIIFTHSWQIICKMKFFYQRSSFCQYQVENFLFSFGLTSNEQAITCLSYLNMLLFSFGIFLFVLVANCSGMNSMKFGRM